MSEHKLPAPGENPGFQTPPPAQPLPGMTGPPIPVGQMVPAPVAGYTPSELADLQKIPGWKPGDPIPSNMAEILSQVQQEVAQDTLPENLQPPVPLNTPQLQVPEPVAMRDLPAAKQAEVSAAIVQAAEGGQATPEVAGGVAAQAVRAQQAEQERLAAYMQQAKDNQAQIDAQQSQYVEGADPSVNAAISGEGARTVVLDDTDAETYAGTDIPKQDAGPAPADTQTGEATAGHTHCPHCEWDLSQPPIPEPTRAEKQRFLQATLGGQPFQKTFRLMNGNLDVVFRELTPQESDLIFEQARIDALNDKFQGQHEHIEWLTRYRLCLQLTRFSCGEQVHNLPESVEGWANGNPIRSSEGTVLPQIYAHVYSQIVKTETLNRLLGNAMLQFTRMLQKMEGNAENENFWSTIELPRS